MNMNAEHEEIRQGFKHFAEARKVFSKYKGKWFIGNDNHVGDIGEYWTMRYFLSAKPELAPSRVSPYDIVLGDGQKLSVKTMSRWNESGRGSPVKGIINKDWDCLVAIKLDEQFEVDQFCLVPLDKISKRIKDGSPFMWWGWLDEFRKDFNSR
ncbi:MAG: hypothetical protein C4542_02465 [Dehalococcoidia bacterium]|nr:MAG: hypothetical protein C4542_02465 [Dehalococcoidia bacterium]